MSIASLQLELTRIRAEIAKLQRELGQLETDLANSRANSALADLIPSQERTIQRTQASIDILEQRATGVEAQIAATPNEPPPVDVPPQNEPEPGADRIENFEPAPQSAISGDYTAVYNPETDKWDVVDVSTGLIYASDIETEQEAIIIAEDASADQNAQINEFGGENIDGSNEQATLAKARAQSQIENQRKQANQGDWRVRLRLANSADYLYRDPALTNPQSGILYPLAITDGVVFPYTPTISSTYSANYNTYDLTHSNYRGLFYQNSYIDEVTIEAVFTAQDTFEANYMLAVIHFFRSVTKMFYGQDTNRGQPPPLVFLQGLGEYQYNLHPCVVRSFSYNLPNDVDYIRARSVNINGTDLLSRRDRATLPTSGFSFSNLRLTAANLSTGAEVTRPAPQTLGTNSPTYVPTKMTMQLQLLPVQSRSQVSKQFSLKQFANGDLIKSGFW